MEFSEYSQPFTGDFVREGRRLMGSTALEHERLLGAIKNYKGYYRPGHLENIRRLFDVSTRTGMRELSIRAQETSLWFAEQISGVIEGERVADLGCCDGFFTVFYALNHPNAQFIGIDLSGEALKSAEERAKKYGVSNVSWVQGDVLNSEAEKYFDADTIILQEVLHLIYLSTDPRKEVKMLKTLAPHQSQGGLVVIGKEGTLPSFQTVDDYTVEKCEVTTLQEITLKKDVTANVVAFRHK